MKINYTYDLSCNSAPAAFKTALQTAANIIDSAIINPITVNIQVGWGENAGEPVDASALGTGGPQNGVTVTYAQLVDALTAAANSNNCGYIAVNLPKTDPTGGIGQWVAFQTQAAVLNIPNPNTGAIDGSIGFATDRSGAHWCYDTTKGIGANQNDFLGTAIHEITHVLGRVSASTGSMSGQQYGANDLYTYASQGKLQLATEKAGGYFSINGGATNLGNFDGTPNGDSADWTVVTDDNGAGQPGTVGAFSFIDLQVMEALGYRMAPAYQLAGATSVDNPVPGAASVNEGEHDPITVQTVGVAPGTSVNYAISGIAASRLMPGKLTGTLMIGKDGTGTIDLGIANDYHTDGSTTATVTIGSASTQVSVNDTSLSPQTPNIFNLTTPTATVQATPGGKFTGGSGLYTVVFSGKLANYTLSQANSGYVVTDNTGVDGTDTLANIGRLQFADTGIALDINGNAGITARILGAVFGEGSLSNPMNPAYVGIGLSYLDGGMSYQNLMQLALTARLGTGFSNADEVNLLYKNLVGSLPDAATLNHFTGMIGSGQFSQASLAVMAADHSLNTANINLVGLQQTGIHYV